MGTLQNLLQSRLQNEVRLLKFANAGSILNALLSTNQLLWPENPVKNCQQTILSDLANLKLQCVDLDDDEKILKLNDFFFNDLDFQIVNDCQSPHSWLIDPVYSNKKGHPLIISILYSLFAEYINLPICLMNHPHFTFLKWVRTKESQLLDLSCNCQSLNSNQLIKAIQQTNQKENSFVSLTQCQVILVYLNMLLDVYQGDESELHKLKVLNTLLELDPNNIDFLKERALLFKNLNYADEALVDINKYFSFVGEKDAASEIQTAYCELTLELESSNTIH